VVSAVARVVQDRMEEIERRLKEARARESREK
jgi:hypothetical protein